MPIVDFPMRRITQEESFAPYLSCLFTNPATGISQEEIALVDTGANACTVPADFAEELGHNIFRGHFGWVWSASHRVDCWQHTFTISIYGMKEAGTTGILVDKENVVLTLENITVDALDCKTPILLGVRGFLENYTLTANYPRKIFSIQDFRAI